MASGQPGSLESCSTLVIMAFRSLAAARSLRPLPLLGVHHGPEPVPVLPRIVQCASLVFETILSLVLKRSDPIVVAILCVPLSGTCPDQLAVMVPVGVDGLDDVAPAFRISLRRFFSAAILTSGSQTAQQPVVLVKGGNR